MASHIVSFDNLKTLISEKNLKNLLLLSGEEDYYCEYAVNNIKKAYLAEGSEQMDFVKLNFESKNFDLDKVDENVMLPPWMSEKRIVVVRNSGIFSAADPKKDMAERFEEFVKTIPDSTLLIFWDDKIDKRKKQLFNVFEKNGYCCDCPILKDYDIEEKLRANLRRSNITIDSDASDSLINRTDKSMRAIASEMNKIVLYCREKGITNVDYNVIDTLCAPDISGKIFDILDGISEGNSSKVLLTLDNLIMQKEPVERIKYSLANHIRQLICAKELKSESKIVERLGAKPYTAKKLARQAPKFETDKLLYLLSVCAKTEYEGRLGKLDGRQSLEIILVLACKSLT